MSYLDSLRNKKIALLGLSIEGYSTLKFLITSGIKPEVIDQKDQSQQSNEIQKFIKDHHIVYHTGQTHLTGLDRFGLIIRSPGIPLWRTELQEYKNEGGTLTSHTKIFFALAKPLLDKGIGKLIGVSGTKGKGTTSTLIFKMLQKSGKKVFLGGNIGTAPLDFLKDIDKNSFVVLELSSFQLEDLTVSPHIAVLLKVTPDHLYSSSGESPNYHRSLDAYWEAKINLLRFQNSSDYIVSYHDENLLQRIKKISAARLFTYATDSNHLGDGYHDDVNLYLKINERAVILDAIRNIKLLGRHNLENILAASLVGSLLAVNLKSIRSVIRSFSGLEHRLEHVAQVSGVDYYDDSFSTTPQTSVAAIKSFNRPLLIILGGSPKGSDYKELGKAIINSTVKAVILIGQTSSQINSAIISASQNSKKQLPKILSGYKNMEEIVSAAVSNASCGDVVLLSPACASFDMFKNYKQRGLLFKKYVIAQQSQ